MVKALLALAIVMSASAELPIWEQLPPIPDPEGFASPFAGVSGGALLVAGGANIPGEKWKEPFVKVWHDRVFLLEEAGPWREAGKLPRPLGYGVSITADDSVLCLGGSDAQQHFADCFRLHWRSGALSTSQLPPLPRPCANACGALAGRTVYLAGGLETPEDVSALHTFWALDLDSPQSGWKELDPWPGPERMLAVAGAHEGSFYLFSGAKLSAGAKGKPVREYLRDAWRYTPGHGWKRLPDLPRPAVAAASPAPVINSQLAILSGDDGANVTFQPIQDHPGFPKNGLLFDPATEQWSALENVPLSRATAPIVTWQNRFILPNGEVRPRVRTNEVWSLRPHQP